MTQVTQNRCEKIACPFAPKNEKQAETFERWNTAVLNSAEDNGYKALFAKKFGKLFK